MAAVAIGILTASVALVTPILLLFFFRRSEFSLLPSSFLDAQEELGLFCALLHVVILCILLVIWLINGRCGNWRITNIPGLR